MPDDKNGTVFASPFKFNKMGKCGADVSEVFPLLGEHVDDLAIIRSMYTDIPDNAAATVMMNTGSTRLVKPSLGAWLTYGLGTENQNLPGFIALSPGGVSPQNLRAAFLPGAYQGTSVNTQNTSVEKLIENIKNNYVSLPEQRKQLDLLETAAKQVRPGGILVYSTCSLEPEENEQLVRKFTDGHKDFALEEERALLPFDQGVDGAYVARLRRT